MAQLCLFGLSLFILGIISSANLAGENDILENTLPQEDDEVDEKIRLDPSGDTCSKVFCMNGGSLVLENCEAKCKCALGYTGEKCEIKLERDVCNPNPCVHGVCLKIETGFYCLCESPYMGRKCEIKPCISNPCQNGGTCLVIEEIVTCLCKEKFIGPVCEFDFNRFNISGCFDGNGIVLTTAGEKFMKDVQIGDEVASGFHQDGSLTYSPVITFIHKDVDVESSFVKLETKSNFRLLVTKNHLLFRSTNQTNFEAVHADKIRIGDFLYTTSENKSVVISIDSQKMTGVFAPLTIEGTIIVNNILVSCYAEVDSHIAAHMAFLPLRVHYHIMTAFSSLEWLWKSPLINEDKEIHQPLMDSNKSNKIQCLDFQGIHCYAKMLCWLFNSNCK